MRGFFRLLTEQHIPFALSSRLDWVDSDPGRYDLVVCPKGVPAKLDKYLRGGGRVLAASAVKPELLLDVKPAEDGASETVRYDFVLDPVKG